MIDIFSFVGQRLRRGFERDAWPWRWCCCSSFWSISTSFRIGSNIEPNLERSNDFFHLRIFRSSTVKKKPLLNWPTRVSARMGSIYRSIVSTWMCRSPSSFHSLYWRCATAAWSINCCWSNGKRNVLVIGCAPIFASPSCWLSSSWPLCYVVR